MNWTKESLDRMQEGLRLYGPRSWWNKMSSAAGREERSKVANELRDNLYNLAVQLCECWDRIKIATGTEERDRS